MKLRPDQPRLSTEERRFRQVDRLTSIRLRMAIGRELDKRGITTPAAIGDALGIPPSEAVMLLTNRVWREGAILQLEAAVARLGVKVPEPMAARPAGGSGADRSDDVRQTDRA
jgi:hypothetical protein